MANWSLNYGLNAKGEGSDKMRCNVTEKGGNGLQIVMCGAIPDGPVSVQDAIDKAVAACGGLDGLNANDPASHVRYLRTIAAFSTELADAIEGN